MAQKISLTHGLRWYEQIAVVSLYGIVYAISLLPFCVLYALSDAVYVLIYHVVGYRKKVVRKNLRNSFPDYDAAKLADIERGFYHYFCDYIFETIKIVSISHDEMRRHMVFNGIEHLERAVSEHRGAAFYIGHYGNWEWITSIGLHLPEGCLGVQVYHVLESRIMDRLMLKLRSKMGTESVSMAETLRRLVKLKQENIYPAVGFISDQSPIIYNVPYWTTFLNQNTPFINGSERIARKLDYMSVYMDVRVVKRGYYEVDIRLIAEHSAQEPENAITQRYSELLEANIRRQPQCWLWSHNRWKRTPESYKNAQRHAARMAEA